LVALYDNMRELYTIECLQHTGLSQSQHSVEIMIKDISHVSVKDVSVIGI